MAPRGRLRSIIRRNCLALEGLKSHYSCYSLDIACSVLKVFNSRYSSVGGKLFKRSLAQRRVSGMFTVEIQIPLRKHASPRVFESHWEAGIHRLGVPYLTSLSRPKQGSSVSFARNIQILVVLFFFFKKIQRFSTSKVDFFLTLLYVVRRGQGLQPRACLRAPFRQLLPSRRYANAFLPSFHQAGERS